MSFVIPERVVRRSPGQCDYTIFAFSVQWFTSELSVWGVQIRTLASLGSGFCSLLGIVTGVRPMEYAQVTAGGIDTADFSGFTLESSLVPGLFAAGEMLDVDGDCGGFNLLFAFSSGLTAGENAAGAALDKHS